jgi:hypothetical protein
MALTSFDKYTLNARLYPALIVFLPIGFTVAGFFPEKFTGFDFLIAIITTFGLSFFLENLARDQGKKKEDGLFQKWGGKPTSLMLRYKDTLLDQTTIKRYHRKLESLIDGLKLPNAGDEASDIEVSDAVCESCTSFLRENTRDKIKFRLIFAELVNYGFRRNLWAMKPAALVIVVISICSLGLPVLLGFIQAKPIIIITLIMDVFLLVFWIFRINPNWIKVTAFEYAKQLLSACDRL